MTTRTLLAMLVVLLSSVAVLGAALPEVLQPNEAADSATELAILKQGINTLKGTLSDTELASRRWFASNDWRSLNFAQYTAGHLAELGYATQIVNQAGWPDGVHTWVLAGIQLAVGTVWVPIEASPEPNQIQQNLGYVPTQVDGTGNLLFDPRYISFGELVTLAGNLPPVAKIRLPGRLIAPRVTVKFVALGASDPDGEIILYLWEFGDGTTVVGTSPAHSHAYAKEGDYVVSLTVVDNRGKSTTASVTARVGMGEPRPQEEDAGGCGCSK